MVIVTTLCGNFLPPVQGEINDPIPIP